MRKKLRQNTTEQGKRVPKFKILDAVIILLILVSVLGIYFRYNLMDTLQNRKNLKEYTVSFTIENIRRSTMNYINIGDELYYSEDDELLGELMAHSEESASPLRPAPASEYFVDQNGATVQVFYPNSESMDARIDANGRFLCEGTYSEDGGFLVNGSRYLAPGQTVQVKTELVTVTLTITDIILAE